MSTTIDRLSDEIADLAADIEAATCRFLLLLAEFDRREGWGHHGCRTCAGWVSWRCGIEPGTAREYVRVARRLEELPVVRAAFSEARLTYSKVRALTRIDTITDEPALVELARNATAAQLETIVRAYRGVLAVAEGDAREAFESRQLHWSVDADGSVRLRAKLPPEQGALLIQAIETTRDDLARGVSAETLDSLPIRNADALLHLADTALAAAETATSTGGDRYQLVVHMDADALDAEAGDGAGARCELEHGAPLPRESARRVACDSSVITIRERDGKPLSVGRKTRRIPPAVRRALRSRDGCCQFPGCTNHRHVDAHHIHHWADGGHTDIENLVSLCRHHHRLVHEGGFSISGSPGALIFTTPTGRRLTPGPSPRARARRDLPNVSAETSIQPTYDRMDLDLCVDAVLASAPVRPPGELLEAA